MIVVRKVCLKHYKIYYLYKRNFLFTYCYINQEILEAKKVRGKTTCKDIHERNLEERKEVTFDKGQAVGPTGKIVYEFTNFIGTISKNPRFINLMYTSWHAVPEDTKKRM